MTDNNGFYLVSLLPPSVPKVSHLMHQCTLHWPTWTLFMYTVISRVSKGQRVLLLNLLGVGTLKSCPCCEKRHPLKHWSFREDKFHPNKWISGKLQAWILSRATWMKAHIMLALAAIQLRVLLQYMGTEEEPLGLTLCHLFLIIVPAPSMA